MFRKLNMTLLQKKKHLVLYQPFPQKKQIHYAVAKGDLELARRLGQEYRLYIKEMYDGQQNQDALFHQVYYEYICTVVEIAYIASENGLNSVIADDIRDEFMVKVSSCNALFEIVSLFGEAIVEFATLVKLSKISYSMSREMKLMIQYIEEHLTENIKLEDVAATAGVSYYYASGLFKKQMGVTMSDFIQQEKIGLAKKLLLVDNLSIHETSQRLHFCSQSYFTKIFKKNCGMTPRKFLNQNGR